MRHHTEKDQLNIWKHVLELAGENWATGRDMKVSSLRVLIDAIGVDTISGRDIRTQQRNANVEYFYNGK